jgi:plastocyanin
LSLLEYQDTPDSWIDEASKEPLKSEILSYSLMKSNLYYVGILATALLVLSGPASFATPTAPTQSTETIDQTQTPTEGDVRVSIAEGSNATVQYYTFTPQSVEINAGDSVTWFSPAELSDIHTVTFVQDPSIISDILLPFAVPAGGGATDFELLPPFNSGEPLIIPTPDGREAIVVLNKHAWYPAVVGANNQATYLEGTDIQTTLNSTVRALNSGIILPPMPPTGGPQPNSTETGTTGEPQIASEASLINETTTTTNATGTTTDVLTVPDDQGTSQPTEGATVEQQFGPFPLVSSFTVTFEEPGTYPYFCAIHPWMVGQVVVGGDTQTETQPELQPEPQPELQPEPQPELQPEPQNQTETQGLGELESPNPLFG